MQHKKLSSIVFLFVFFLISSFSFCQENGIILMKKDSSSSVFLKENKRIKVQLANNKKYFGRFKIENDSTFSIKGNLISLDSIVKIKRKSLGFTIANPIIIYFGFNVAAIGLVLTGPYFPIGVFVSGIGTSIILIPLISNKHPSTNWNYSIGLNPKIKTSK